MSNLVPIPPTHAIADPQTRAVVDSLAQNFRSLPQNYVQTDEFTFKTQQALAELFDPTNVQPGGRGYTPYQNILASISNSELFKKLGTSLAGAATFAQIAEVQTRVNEVLSTQQVTADELAAAIQAEANARAAAILEEATIRGNSITQETTSRITADEALQTQINTLSAASSGDFQDLIAALQEEQAARVAADTAEATNRQTLAAQLRGNYTGTDPSMLSTGLLYNERQARVTSEGALASSISALSATVNTNNTTVTALISTEASARATADNAITTSLTQLTSRVGTTESSITSLQSTQASQATSLSSVITRVGTAETNISTLQTTTANQASQITSISATANAKVRTFVQTSAPTASATGDMWFDSDDGYKAYRWSGTAWVEVTDSRIASNAAAITTEASARVSKDNAMAAAINTLWAAVGGSAALIQDSQLASVTPTAVTASKWNSVVAAVTDPNTGQVNSASLKQEFNTYASTTNGALGALQAQYTVKVDVNGYVAGFGLASTLNNGVPTSEFIVLADRFAVASPGSPTVVPFAVENGQVYMNSAVFATRSGTSGARMEMNAQVIKVFDSNGVLRVKIGNLTA